MKDEALEIMVEEAMRISNYNSYEDYNNEELREQFRCILKGENTDASSKDIQQI